GTYLCGRVMLDIYACLKKRLFPAGSPLPGLGKALLIEMYRQALPKPQYVPSPVLVPRAFISSEEVGNGWPIIAHHPVDPHTVEFPESLIGYRSTVGQVAFQCGEIRLPLPLRYEALDQVEEHCTVYSGLLWLYTCLRVLGRDTEVPAEYKAATLTGGDLRFSPHRDAIYQHLPFPKDLSYFEKQAQLGLHLERLYA